MTLSKVAIVVRKVWTCWSVWIRTVETDHLLLLKDFLCLLGWQGFSECCSSYELLCIVVWLVRCRWAEASTTSFYILWTWPWSSALYLLWQMDLTDCHSEMPLQFLPQNHHSAATSPSLYTWRQTWRGGVYCGKKRKAKHLYSAICCTIYYEIIYMLTSEGYSCIF